MQKKILITGCSGFIGRHAVSYSLKNGYRVVGLDLKPLGIKDKDLAFVRGDINDMRAVERAARGCRYVLHLAAMTSLPDFRYDLHRSYGTNVMGFLNVIEAAKRNRCAKFAYASSSAVYGDSFSEESVIDVKAQRNHYGKSKLIDEMIADSYADSFKLSTVGLRYFNVYGPGEEVKERSSPVTQFLKSRRKDGAITIFGDGKQSKDFIHVDDAIRITFMLIESRKGVGVFNVGTGVSTSFNEVARIMGPAKVAYVRNPYLSSYIFYLKADTRRLRKAIGKYQFIRLKDGISRLMGRT